MSFRHVAIKFVFVQIAKTIPLPCIWGLGNDIKYQGGHMMRNTDVRTIRLRQETINSNGGHDACFGYFKLQITSLFIVRNIKRGYLLS